MYLENKSKWRKKELQYFYKLIKYKVKRNKISILEKYVRLSR